MSDTTLDPVPLEPDNSTFLFNSDVEIANSTDYDNSTSLSDTCIEGTPISTFALAALILVPAAITFLLILIPCVIVYCILPNRGKKKLAKKSKEGKKQPPKEKAPAAPGGANIMTEAKDPKTDIYMQANPLDHLNEAKVNSEYSLSANGTAPVQPKSKDQLKKSDAVPSMPAVGGSVPAKSPIQPSPGDVYITLPGVAAAGPATPAGPAGPAGLRVAPSKGLPSEHYMPIAGMK